MNNRATQPQRGGERLTRAQRRAAERAQAQRNRTAGTRKRKQGLSRNTVVGGIVTLLVVVAIVAYGVYQSTTSSASALTNLNDFNPGPNLLQTNTIAPNFTLKDLNGKSYTLAAQRGHPVLLEYFAVWCPHCQAEAPIMASLTKTYVPRGVRVWSILASPYGRNYDISGGRDTRLANKGDLTWFAQNFNVQHPQLIDPTFSTVNRYMRGQYPTLYVIDRNGLIRLVHEGEMPYKTIASSLNKALAG